MNGLLYNIGTLITCERHRAQASEIPQAAILWKEGTITWRGAAEKLDPQAIEAIPQECRFDARGALVIPGLVDCHTHLAFGGWREDEFELRCQGTPYLEIARGGGGISRSVHQTRQASFDELLAHSMEMAGEMIKIGVTSIECKSGYGLDLQQELRLLKVYRELSQKLPVGIVSTLLAAHVIAPEYRSCPDDYVLLICEKIIPETAEEGLAEFCDVFVEEGAFSVAQARRILLAAQAKGLDSKLHVDQLHDGGGAALAADLHAISADHLEYANDAGIESMAEAKVVAVALPLASLYLNQPPMDARRFIRQGVEVAVATDFNPGSAPSYHLPFAMTLACTMNHMTPYQALLGATRIAAKAINREAGRGTVSTGKRADLVVLDTPSINHWLYHFKANAVQSVFIGGERVV